MCNLCGLHTVKAMGSRRGGSGVLALAANGSPEVLTFDLKAFVSFGEKKCPSRHERHVVAR